MRKKLLRLADNLLAAILKEKKAYLDRAFLDQRSENYRNKQEEIEQLRFAGVDSLLVKMGTANWKQDAIDQHELRPSAHCTFWSEEIIMLPFDDPRWDQFEDDLRRPTVWSCFSIGT